MYHTKAEEYWEFFNNIFENPKGIISNKFVALKHQKSTSTSSIYPLVLLAAYTGVLPMYDVLNFLILYFFPEQTFANLVLNLDPSFIVKFAGIVTETALLALVEFLGGIGAITAVVALVEIYNQLKLLKLIVIVSKTKSHNFFDHITSLYRKLQIFVVFSNQCFQTNLWPIVVLWNCYANRCIIPTTGVCKPHAKLIFGRIFFCIFCLWWCSIYIIAFV